MIWSPLIFSNYFRDILQQKLQEKVHHEAQEADYIETSFLQHLQGKFKTKSFIRN